MNTYTFTIPGAPVGKERPRKGKYGNFYTPPKTKAFEQQVALFAQEACPDMIPVLTICHLDVKWHLNKYCEEELEVTIVQTDEFPSKKKCPDGDNVLKSIADGLQGIAYKNDSQIHWWSLNKE